MSVKVLYNEEPIVVCVGEKVSILNYFLLKKGKEMYQYFAMFILKMLQNVDVFLLTPYSLKKTSWQSSSHS